MTLPTLSGDRVSSVSRRLEAARAVVRSPFTGQDVSHDLGGRWWAYDVQLGPTAAFLGPYTTLGAPRFRGAGQTGRVIVTDEWLPFVVLRAGMCFSFFDGLGTRMHMLTADTTVNAAGIATLTVSPGVRTAPPDDAQIEYLAPKVQLRMPSAVAAQVSTGAYYTFSFTAEETL